MNDKGLRQGMGMKYSKYGSVYIGVIYFSILLSMAFWVYDIPVHFDPFSLTLQGLTEVSLLGDPTSFATAATDIARNGWISSENNWIFNLWPPGFVLLEAMILKVMGPNVPIILVLQILSALLFSIVLTLFFNILRELIRPEIAVILPALIFIFPVSRVFLLHPIGISLGENFSVGFFLLSILMVLRAIGGNSYSYALWSGLFLALSAYFRSQFEIILLIFTVWGVIFWIASKTKIVLCFSDPKNIKITAQMIGLMLVVAHVATIPWRAYHWLHEGSPSWVYTSQLYYENATLPSNELIALGGGWLVAGGANIPCRINPTICNDKKNAKTIFYSTYFNNISEWYRLKFSNIESYWFSSVHNWTSVSTVSSLTDYVFNGINILVFFASLALMASRKLRSQSYSSILWYLSFSITTTYAVIFSFAPFEVRYFYFPKIFILFLSVLVLSMYFFTRKEK